jgi:PAS domain S-box-containing protein
MIATNLIVRHPTLLDSVTSHDSYRSMQQFPSNYPLYTEPAENWSERVLQDITGLLHVLSPTGKVLYCSESSIELTGYHPQELVGRSLTDFLHIDDLDLFIHNFRLAFSSMSRIKVHYRIRCKDNSYLLLESIGQPKQDARDQAFFAIAQPYLSKSNGLLDSFLELKMENDRLKKHLNELVQQYPPLDQRQFLPYYSQPLIDNSLLIPTSSPQTSPRRPSSCSSLNIFHPTTESLNTYNGYNTPSVASTEETNNETPLMCSTELRKEKWKRRVSRIIA